MFWPKVFARVVEMANAHVIEVVNHRGFAYRVYKFTSCGNINPCDWAARTGDLADVASVSDCGEIRYAAAHRNSDTVSPKW